MVTGVAAHDLPPELVKVLDPARSLGTASLSHGAMLRHF
jgi:hypothetical protein